MKFETLQQRAGMSAAECVDCLEAFEAGRDLPHGQSDLDAWAWAGVCNVKGFRVLVMGKPMPVTWVTVVDADVLAKFGRLALSNWMQAGSGCTLAMVDKGAGSIGFARNAAREAARSWAGLARVAEPVAWLVADADDWRSPSLVASLLGAMADDERGGVDGFTFRVCWRLNCLRKRVGWNRWNPGHTNGLYREREGLDYPDKSLAEDVELIERNGLTMATVASFHWDYVKVSAHGLNAWENDDVWARQCGRQSQAVASICSRKIGGDLSREALLRYLAAGEI